MSLKKRKIAEKRSVEPEKGGDKDPKEKKPSVESRPTSDTRSEKDNGPAGAFLGGCTLSHRGDRRLGPAGWKHWRIFSKTCRSKAAWPSW